MSSKRFVIGITGGIATGKTAVLREFARWGIPTVSSDSLAHACLERGKPVYREVVQRYGWKVLRSTGAICRTHLGEIVFAKPDERKWLERRIHPRVISELKSFIRKHTGIIALDIPLLFEAKLQKLVDVILVVGASPGIQIQRLRRRDGLSREAALLRINAQLPMAYKKKHADYYIPNQGSRRALRKAVQRVLNRLRKRA